MAFSARLLPIRIRESEMDPDFVGRIDSKNSFRYKSLGRSGLRVLEFCRGTTSSLPLEAMSARVTSGYCKSNPTA